MNEHMNHVEFKVPLSGSQLFDLHSRVTAKHICDLYPPLSYEVDEEKKEIRIFGDMNDFWYQQWEQALFSIGER